MKTKNFISKLTLAIVLSSAGINQAALADSVPNPLITDKPTPSWCIPLDGKVDANACNYLAAAGWDESLTTPAARRFLPFMLKVSQFMVPRFMNSTTDQVIETMKEKDMRMWLFRVEGLFRIYDKLAKKHLASSDEGKAIRDARLASKQLEDWMGNYVDANLYVKRATKRKLGEFESKKAGVLQVLNRQVVESRKTLSDILENGWFAPNRKESAVDVIVAGVKVINQKMKGHDEEDRLFYLEAVADHLKGNVAKVLGSANHNDNFDLTILQGRHGVHELRRQLRWFAINVQQGNGVIVDEDPSPENKLVTVPGLLGVKLDDPKTAIYLEIDRDPAVKACPFSRDYFIEVTNMIGRIKNIKNSGEDLEQLTDALTAVNYAETVGKSANEAAGLFEDKADYVTRAELIAKIRGFRAANPDAPKNVSLTKELSEVNAVMALHSKYGHKIPTILGEIKQFKECPITIDTLKNSKLPAPAQVATEEDESKDFCSSFNMLEYQSKRETKEYLQQHADFADFVAKYAAARAQAEKDATRIMTSSKDFKPLTAAVPVFNEIKEKNIFGNIEKQIRDCLPKKN